MHTASLLPNGQVLVAGGGNSVSIASTELYDPASELWTVTGSLSTSRVGHTGVLLPNGKVLVAGGEHWTSVSGGGYTVTALSSAELYDPVTRAWAATGTMTSVRDYPAMTLLLNGKVLIAGGHTTAGQTLATAELYDTGLGFSASWQPQVSTFTSPLTNSRCLTL